MATRCVTTSAVFIAICGPALAADVGAATGNTSANTTIYSPDPGHLWNRLHAAMLIREGPDKLFYGEDRLEPLLWWESEHLLNGKSAEKAASILDEFVRDQGDKLVDNSLKKVVLQRDLWLIANALAGNPGAQTGKKLETRLVQAIQRLALSQQQIQNLPDNYDAAIKSNRYAAKFDPNKSKQSYLPPDLFDPRGPWVSVGLPQGPTAPLHLSEDGSNRFTNSTFLVFLKLPGGREKTTDFLKQLAAKTGPPLARNVDPKTRRSFPYLPPANLPPWPKGTEAALVRRMLLIDSKFQIVASPVVESVQLRITTVDTPEVTEILGMQRSQNGNNWHAALEFQLRRRPLFKGEYGGLLDVSAERDFKTGFGAHGWDPFIPEHEVNATGRSFPDSALSPPRRDQCANCHNLPGVYSFNSYAAIGPPMRLLDEEETEAYLRRVQIPQPYSVAEIELQTAQWKRKQAAWKQLAAHFSK